MSKITIIEGNSNDKDNVRAYMVKGEPGDDGVSPNLTVQRNNKTVTVTATDTEGTTTATVEDGVSPTVTTSKTAGVTTVTITDIDGVHTATIDDGQTYEVPAGGIIGFEGATIPAGYEEAGSISVPTGSIFPFAGATAPSGYLICDGAAISRTTYSDLFSLLSTTYGAGDGSTTFNIPNLKGKVPVGLDSTDTDFDTLGETGGEKTNTLTINEIPAHNHNLSVQGGNTTSYGFTYDYSNEKRMYNGTDVIGETGGGQPHNNLQPYIVLNYIIKT